MRYKYFLEDGLDEIEEDHFDKDKFNIFLSELTVLNQDYGYSVYLYGSYLDYIINRKPYTDINFLITNKNVLEIDKLKIFLTSFHHICKKHNIIYNLGYAISLRDSHINTNSKVMSIFNTPSTDVLSLYLYIVSGDWCTGTGLAMGETGLFKRKLSSNLPEVTREGRKSFPPPIKIV